MFVHLKKELDADPANLTDLTPDAIPKDVQSLLAAVRTDLDSFNEVEAYALMTSGYRMTEYEFPRAVPKFPVSNEPPVAWEFLKIEAPMKQVDGVDAAHHEIMELLKVATYQGFKIWRLIPALRVLGWFLLAVLVLAAGWACNRWRDYPLLTPGASLLSHLSR